MRRLSLFTFTLLVSCSSRETPTGESEPLEPRAIASTLTKAFGLRPIAAGGAVAATFPTRATGALRVGTGDTWLEVTPIGARDVPCTDEGGMTTCAGALPDVDVAYVREQGRIEDLRLARTRAAAARSSWSLRWGPAIAFARVVDGHVEIVDRDGIVRLATEPAWAVDAKGVKRELTLSLEGTTLTGTLDSGELTAPIAIDPAWSAATPMAFDRVMHRAFKLSTGKVLVVGGSSSSGERREAELYDPATNSWMTKPLPLHPKSGNVALQYGNKSTNGVFANGARVLLAAGSNGQNVATDFDVFDAVAENFYIVTPGPDYTRGFAAVVGLEGNRVALIGGSTGGSDFADTIVTYDIPTSAASVSPGPEVFIGTKLSDVSALRLPVDGRVFISGGRTSDGPATPIRLSENAFLWNPAGAAQPFKLPNMPTRRASHAAVYVPVASKPGKVALIGGEQIFGDSTVPETSAGSVLFDLETNTWSIGPRMSAARSMFGISKLADGRTLISGGGAPTTATFTALATTEIFDPVKLTFTLAGTMASPRGAHQQATLNDGTALAIGGVSGANEGFIDILKTVEKFTIQPAAATCVDNGECTSGFCVDGVCCNTACAGQCEACDVAGKVGTCTPITDRPHGTRAACEVRTGGGACDMACNGVDVARCNFAANTTTCGTAACVNGSETHASTCDGAGKCSDVPKSCGDFVCDATACKTTCASKADCSNPNHFCENGKCLPVLPAGSVCASDAACATGNCVDGTCCESRCEGQCQACDVPGQAGKCVPIKGKPHGARTTCEANATDACESKACDGSDTTKCAAKVGPCTGNFGCDAVALACKTSCSGAADCAGGYECDDGKCVPRASKCSPDLSESIATDGVTKTACTPLVCRDGSCLTKCVSSADCQGGFLCDSGGSCVASGATAPAEEGGCSYGARHSSTGTSSNVGLVAFAGLLALFARRITARV